MREPHQHERSGLDPLVVIVFALGALLALPCVILVLLSRWLPQWLITRRVFWLLVAVMGGIGVGCSLLLAHIPSALHDQLVSLLGEAIREAKSGSWSALKLWIDLKPIWLENLYFAPGVAFIAHLFAGQSAEQRLLTSHQQRIVAIRNASKRVGRRMARRSWPDRVREQMVLGLPVQGDLREWIIEGQFVVPTHELCKHGVIIGGSGNGKSMSLLRVAVGAALLGWQVIFCDGKGDIDAGKRFIAAMMSAGIQLVKMYPTEPYNGWMGDEEALLSRLLAVEEYSDSHYRAVAENLLRLAITVPGNPVKNSRDLLLRLNLTNGLLLSLYAGDADHEAYLTYLSKRDPLGVYNRYAALLGKLRGLLDGKWSYDTVDAGYICLDGLALSGIVSGLGRYFVEDFAHYAGRCKPMDRRVLFIFDELGAVDVNLTNLYERVRSRGVSVFVSGQSDSSIAYRGFIQNADRLLSTTTTIILHACNNPEGIIARAGTQQVIEEVIGVTGSEMTGHGTMRVAESPKVDPNIVRQLATGEVYVLAHGKAHMVRVMPVDVDTKALAEAEEYVRSGPQKSDSKSLAIQYPSTTLPSVPASSTTSKETTPVSYSSLSGQDKEDEQDEDLLT